MSEDTYLKIVKRILRYLSGTTNFCLWYSKGSACCLVGFSDYDFVGCKLDRKVTSDTCHFFGICLVLWHRKSNKCCSFYREGSICCSQELLWSNFMA